MTGQVRTGQVRTGQARAGHGRTRQVKSGKVNSGQLLRPSSSKIFGLTFAFSGHFWLIMTDYRKKLISSFDLQKNMISSNIDSHTTHDQRWHVESWLKLFHITHGKSQTMLICWCVLWWNWNSGSKQSGVLACHKCATLVLAKVDCSTFLSFNCCISFPARFWAVIQTSRISFSNIETLTIIPDFSYKELMFILQIGLIEFLEIKKNRQNLGLRFNI